MPALNVSNIKDAKYGGTDLKAVYKGSVQIWPVLISENDREPIEESEVEDGS